MFQLIHGRSVKMCKCTIQQFKLQVTFMVMGKWPVANHAKLMWLQV